MQAFPPASLDCLKNSNVKRLQNAASVSRQTQQFNVISNCNVNDSSGYVVNYVHQILTVYFKRSCFSDKHLLEPLGKLLVFHPPWRWAVVYGFLWAAFAPNIVQMLAFIYSIKRQKDSDCRAATACMCKSHMHAVYMHFVEVATILCGFCSALLRNNFCLPMSVWKSLLFACS